MKIIFVGLVLFLVTGCVSAINSAKLARTQNILVQTPFADGAKCKITDARGVSWRARRTPISVAVLEGHSPLHVVCRKKGFKNTTLTVREHKEELLTIDGERVTLGLYDQFTTKAPRLFPTVVKEATGIILDPLGNLSTKYPEEIVVWMEPLKWDSEEQMREWAFEKRVWENQQMAMVADAKETDDARKIVRRGKKRVRKEKRAEIIKNVKEGLAEALDPENINPAPALREVGSKIADTLDPRKPFKWLNKKRKEFEGPWKPELGSVWKPSYKSVKDRGTKESGWLSGLSHSTRNKKKSGALKIGDRNIEEKLRAMEELRKKGEAPPWVKER